jgi:glycosyltransferase involved in cell wall biosynthesis
MTPAALADLLHEAHYFIRSERRRRLFQKLVRFPVDIVWDGELPETRGEIAARIEPKLPFAQALARIARARAMVMSLNAFTHSLSERLLSAMRSGCVPIVQTNALISDLFRDGVDLLLLDSRLGNLEEAIARAGDPDVLAEISAAAQRRVATEFSVATRVRQLLQAAAIPLPARAA